MDPNEAIEIIYLNNNLKKKKIKIKWDEKTDREGVEERESFKKKSSLCFFLRFTKIGS